jgi:hypothetical protein
MFRLQATFRGVKPSYCKEQNILQLHYQQCRSSHIGGYEESYVGYPENSDGLLEKEQEFISKPFILPFDVHTRTLRYFST